MTKKKKPILLFLYGILLFVITPFLYFRITFDPVLAPRQLWVSIVMFVFTLIFILGKPYQKSFKFLNSKAVIIFLLYILFSAISIFNAVNLSEGLVELIKMLVLFTLLLFGIEIFKNIENPIHYLSFFVLIGAFGLCLIGFYQYVVNAFGESLNGIYDVKGTMANKNQFSIALFLTLPFIVNNLFQKKRSSYIPSIITLYLILVLLVLLQTRSVWVALIVSVFFTLIIYAPGIRKIKIQKAKSAIHRTILIFFASIVLAIGSVYILNIAAKQQKAKSISTVSATLNTIVDKNSRFDSGRLEIWEQSLEMFKDHPIIGLGLGNWKLNLHAYQEDISLDRNLVRPHNDFIWILTETGLLGLITFLAFLIMIGYYGIKILYAQTDTQNKVQAVLIGFGIIGYLTFSMFTFPKERINHQIYLFTFFALIIALYNRINQANNHQTDKLTRFTIPVSLIISIVAISVFSIRFYSEIYTKRAILYYNDGQWNRVITNIDKAYTKISTLDPFGNPLPFLRGVAKLKLDDLNGALDDFEKSIPLKPNFPTPYNNIGIIKAQQKKYGEAIKNFDKAIQLKANYKDAYANRGVAKAMLGNKDGAIQDFDKAIEIDSHYIKAYMNRAKTHANSIISTELKSAIEDYTQVLAIDSLNKEALQAQAKIYLKTAQFRKAENDYFTLHKMDAKNAAYLMHLADLYLSENNYHKAIAWYDSALILTPKNLEAIVNKGICYHALKKYTMAIQTFNDALDIDTTFAHAYVNLANSYLALQQYKKALKASSDAIKYDVNNPIAFYNRGIAFHYLLKNAKACADWEKAFQLGYAQAHGLLNKFCK
jgi:tetratricopeptide (TPR) repeat protein